MIKQAVEDVSTQTLEKMFKCMNVRTSYVVTVNGAQIEQDNIYV